MTRCIVPYHSTFWSKLEMNLQLQIAMRKPTPDYRLREPTLVDAIYSPTAPPELFPRPSSSANFVTGDRSIFIYGGKGHWVNHALHRTLGSVSPICLQITPIDVVELPLQTIGLRRKWFRRHRYSDFSSNRSSSFANLSVWSFGTGCLAVQNSILRQTQMGTLYGTDKKTKEQIRMK